MESEGAEKRRADCAKHTCLSLFSHVAVSLIAPYDSVLAEQHGPHCPLEVRWEQSVLERGPTLPLRPATHNTQHANSNRVSYSV